MAGRSPTRASPSRKPVADRVAAEIEALIRRRDLRPGQRLPSERALSEQLGVSRTSLREAITRLATRGVVEVRKTGLVAGQTRPGDWAQRTIAAPLAPLVTEHVGYGHDVMEIRHALEGAAAQAAATRADAEDLARLRIAYERMREAHGGTTPPMDEARLDAAFHLAIAEASHNAILYQVMSSLFGLLQASISESLEKLYLLPRDFEAVSQQHDRLYHAILAGDAAEARRASDTHLTFVETTIRQIDDDLARKARVNALRAAGISPDEPELNR
ncbi:FCD domain-containing protein [Paracoccus limosus]|uniref:Pyruvate dehydrogenase complex repressor n=1 Tax=Paracoccus limosus TaxID=913252 RepID=A0A844GZP8_9RHOB|nr:FCD domain-containing protein [Paracoccus limosus]MTH34099.1 FCD domain-containing protein [Paracoccus limosus]